MAYISVQNFYDHTKDQLRMSVLNPGVPLTRKIHSAEIHRPGLALSGFFDYFAFDCVQIIGKTEIRFLNKLNGAARRRNLKRFFSYRMPCIIVSKNQLAPKDFLEEATRVHVPVLKSVFKTATVASQVTVYIENANAPEIRIHATLLDVYSVGTLLMGQSGVGKSECALELIERGHRLVADDIVEISKRNQQVIGRSNEILGHHMEIRGLGIIDIRAIFGVGAIRHQKPISLCVTLERWKKRREYERLGLEDRTYEILGIRVPHLIIPVRPGRNIPILIETAALTRRLKRSGIDSANEFNYRLIRTMRSSVKESE